MTGERECSELVAGLVAAYDASEAVISPGSRNAPLIAAFDRREEITKSVVIDERSAGFVALGIAEVTGRPVAMVCTSGTAMLNYAPALSEAAAKHLPLIAITADRPLEKIGRNNPQTIRQNGAYGEIVKGSYDISARYTAGYIKMVVSEALNMATAYPAGPVHINVQIPDPTVSETEARPNIHEYDRNYLYIGPEPSLSDENARELAAMLATPTRVMIVAGAYGPSHKLERALTRIVSFGNYVVVADSTANLHLLPEGLAAMPLFKALEQSEVDAECPDIVITYGAPILSTELHGYIQRNRIQHWHVGPSEALPDTFGTLRHHIDILPENFFACIAGATRRPKGEASNFGKHWLQLYKLASSRTDEYIKKQPWNDLGAITKLLEMTPRHVNVQLSNGMAVRYAQYSTAKFHRVDNNRGVSGIDGTTSTAVGASMAYDGVTMLVSGDMSAAYDIGILFNKEIPGRFKLVIIENGGGRIFDKISATREYDGVERYMVADPMVDFVAVGEANGFDCYKASSFDELRSSFKRFITQSDKPAMLVIDTRNNHE